MQSNVFEPPDDREIIPREERVQILEEEEGGLDLFDDQIQRRQRLAGGRVPAFLGLDRSAGRHQAGAVGPLEHPFLSPGSELLDHFLDAHLLARDDVKNGVPCVYQRFDLALETHGLAGTTAYSAA